MRQFLKFIRQNKFQAAVLSVLVILIIVIGFDVYARTAGKISDPFGGWPTDAKGYVGHPTDATMDTTVPIAGDDTIYSMLGKIYSKPGGSTTVTAPSACGTCTEKRGYSVYQWMVYYGSYRYHSSTGCCKKAWTTWNSITNAYWVCGAPNNGTMISSGADASVINSGQQCQDPFAGGVMPCPAVISYSRYYICYR